MNALHKILVASSAACVLAVTAPAQAAETVDGYTLDTGSFGTGLGVHSTGTQSGTTLDGVVNNDGSAVTFSSSDSLTMTGSGEATVYPLSGFISDLDVIFEKAWDNITFAFTGDAGTFTLLVNGTSLFTQPACTICTVGKGENKFTLSGAGITSLAFTFDPGVSTAKQFRVEGLTAAVPEPATWALLLLGFGAVGGAMRTSRRQKSRPAAFA